MGVTAEPQNEIPRKMGHWKTFHKEKEEEEEEEEEKEEKEKEEVEDKTLVWDFLLRFSHSSPGITCE